MGEGLVNETLTNANFPAISLLATAGVIGLFAIIRWMVRYQREFTNFYVDENNKLREQRDSLEAEILEKDAKLTEMVRESLRAERANGQHIMQLEATVARHEATIERLERRLNDAT